MIPFKASVAIMYDVAIGFHCILISWFPYEGSIVVELVSFKETSLLVLFLLFGNTKSSNVCCYPFGVMLKCNYLEILSDLGKKFKNL